jgi:hypothetical protein
MPAEAHINKLELFNILVENRERHRDTFLRAQAGYRERMIEEFERRLKDARDGLRIDTSFGMPVPEDHTDDYDREIRMLEMEIDDTIRLSAHEFDRYVMDNWGWKASFTMSNAPYL